MLRASALKVQKRLLSIHEYRSASLLTKYGVNVPRGRVAFSPEEAQKVADEIGNVDVVVKAQVLAGGRGKGTFSNGYRSGVHMTYSSQGAKEVASKMLGQKLITKQTGAHGKPCNAVYIVERVYARREFYLAIIMDRAQQEPVIVASSQGGMDIEAVAAENPSAVMKFPIKLSEGLSTDLAEEIAVKIGFSPTCLPEATKTILALYKIFNELDATQIEINPLSESVDHRVLAMDAKLNFDDNAEFRQASIFEMRDKAQEDADELKASSMGLNFIKLDGNIGCLVNGAGLAMATMDIIKLSGGDPANFLDVGGAADRESIRAAFEIISKDTKVSTMFVNIFGGIVRCDTIAQGLIDVAKEMDLDVPIVARLQGTKQDEAHQLIKDSGLKIFYSTDLDHAAERACKLSNLVQQAREADLHIRFDMPS